MNIFLPYEKNVEDSIESLDNIRLVKQIQEMKVLLDASLVYLEGNVPNKYFRHPVAQFYKDNPRFLAYYGWKCCDEYFFRFVKQHNLRDYFIDKVCELFKEYRGKKIPQPDYTPYYMEGSIGQPNYIRATENVSDLFQDKLIKKWQADKAKGKQPRWTNREVPEFYKKYLKDLEG